MPSESYKGILELAVLEACRAELQHLATQKERDQSISEGLSMLRDLQFGIKPDYDHSWIPLLHASWYHLKHVNFLQTELADRLKQYAGPDVIRVVDFGCGTMPVMWAIALVLADPENELTNQRVAILNYDESDEMKALGHSMWYKLGEIIENRANHCDECSMLHNAIGRITESEIKFKSGAHLLTAIHCLYDTEVCNTVNKAPIADKCVTLTSGKADELGLKFKESIVGKWSGNLEKLTKFRAEEIGRFCPHSFLNRFVTWNNRNVVLVDLQKSLRNCNNIAKKR